MKQRLRKQQKISMKLKILWKDKIDQPLPHQSFQWKVRVDYQKWNWKWSRSVVSDSLQPLQAPPSMGFSRHEYWSGLPLPSPRLTRPDHFMSLWPFFYDLIKKCIREFKSENGLPSLRQGKQKQKWINGALSS